MLSSAIPTKFPIPFANSAGTPTYSRPIPQASQIGIQAGAASLTDGFPPVCFTPRASGGTPMWGADLNGLLNQVTAWLQWVNAGAPVAWDNAFSASIGGYPKGALVQSQSVTLFGYWWLSTVDNNTTNPDTGGAGWTLFSFLGSATTGDVRLTYKTSAPPGWVMLTDGSIGNVGSGATYAAADAATLYVMIWNSVSNSFAPVNGGRGANGSADFLAPKRMAMPLLLGRALAVAGSGAGLTSRALGEWYGAETNTMTLAQLVQHTHPIPGVGSGGQNGSGALGNTSPTSTTGVPPSTTVPPAASNILQPTGGLNVMVKL